MLDWARALREIVHLSWHLQTHLLGFIYYIHNKKYIRHLKSTKINTIKLNCKSTDNPIIITVNIFSLYIFFHHYKSIIATFSPLRSKKNEKKIFVLKCPPICFNIRLVFQRFLILLIWQTGTHCGQKALSRAMNFIFFSVDDLFVICVLVWTLWQLNHFFKCSRKGYFSLGFVFFLICVTL